MRNTLLGLGLVLAACGGSSSGDDDAPDASSDDCTLTADTTATGDTSPSGCALVTRDTSACEADRIAAGLSGAWLDVSCRVSLTVTTAGGQPVIRAETDNLPDHRSNYFWSDEPCWESYEDAIQNPNKIEEQAFVIDFPMTPDPGIEEMQGAVVGMALNGVVVFGNFAAPGDDIFEEALTFDRCGAHPQNTGVYHYHGEPYSLTYDDDALVGFLRDGYPVYGRRDADGTVPDDLDAAGGHTSTTPHSPSTAVYHHHLSEQTSTSPGTAGETQWFLTTGQYGGAAPACPSC